MSKLASKDRNILGTEPVSDLLKKFATPAVIAMIVGALYNIVDQIFIGNNIGFLGNAATNVSFPLTTLCISVTLLIGIGGSANFNLRLGEGKPEEAKKYLGNSFAMVAIVSLVLTVLVKIFLDPLLRAFGATDELMSYARTYTRITSNGFFFMILTNAGTALIRADGSPKYSMASVLVGCIVNVILDACFISGLGWGMAGAAWATVIGQGVSALMVIYYARDFRTVQPKKEDYKPQAKYIKQIASLGVAPFFNQITLLAVQIIMNNSVGYYGQFSRFGSEIPLAVIGIGMKIFMIFFSCAIGISQGMQPIVSYNYGAKNYDRAKEAYTLSIKIGSGIMVGAFLLFQFVPGKLLALFGEGSKEYFEFGNYFFRIYLMMTCVSAFQPITTNLMTSIGKAKKGIFISLTRQLIFFIPLALILPKFFGIMGLLYTGPVADFLAFLVSVIMARREFKNMDYLDAKNKNRLNAQEA